MEFGKPKWSHPSHKKVMSVDYGFDLFFIKIAYLGQNFNVTWSNRNHFKP